MRVITSYYYTLSTTDLQNTWLYHNTSLDYLNAFVIQLLR